MEILKNKTELEKYIQTQKLQKKTIGFAPTMGALHDGHLSLYRQAKMESDCVISSIFVNPTQFNNPEDLKKYPRNTNEDLRLLKDSKIVDAVYLPEIADLYPEGAKSKSYDFDGLENQMEGTSRPGHFDGVGTVIELLFSQIKPDIAFFGEKDFQQLMIIKKLVEKLNLGVVIKGVPTMRAENGLALSSRNQRLSEEAKNNASILYKTLLEVKKSIHKDPILSLKNRVSAIFEDKKNMQLEYFLIANENTLKEVQNIEKDQKYRAFIVVHVEGVRLIDNMSII